MATVYGHRYRILSYLPIAPLHPCNGPGPDGLIGTRSFSERCPFFGCNSVHPTSERLSAHEQGPGYMAVLRLHPSFFPSSHNWHLRNPCRGLPWPAKPLFTHNGLPSLTTPHH